MLNSFYTQKNKFITADFSGRYVAELSKSTSIANFSEITIVDGKLTNVSECEYRDSLFDNLETFFYNKSVNLEVYLNHKDLKDKYVFVEEFDKLLLKDINLSNHQKDGNDTYGIVSGRVVCHLEDLNEIDILNDKTFIINKQIDFGDMKKRFSFLKVVKNSFSNFKLFFQNLYNNIKLKFFTSK